MTTHPHLRKKKVLFERPDRLELERIKNGFETYSEVLNNREKSIMISWLGVAQGRKLFIHEVIEFENGSLVAKLIKGFPF